MQGNSLAVFAPHVNPGTAHQDRPARVSPNTISHPTFNRGDSVTRPLAVTASLKPAAPTPQAIQEAQQAQAQAPANAGIVTAKTPFKTTLHKPLTSLPPVVQQTRPATTTVTPSVQTGEHNAANAPLTGESVKPHVSQPNATAPAQTFHQPSANPNAEHNAAPFTGESVTPSTTQHQFHQQETGQQPQVQPQVHQQQPQVNQQQVEQVQQARQAQQAQEAQQAHQQQLQQQAHQQQQASGTATGSPASRRHNSKSINSRSSSNRSNKRLVHNRSPSPRSTNNRRRLPAATSGRWRK